MNSNLYENIKLTDVMRAVHKIRLQNRLRPPVFTFLFGLLLEANEKKFPETMLLYPADEIGIGGGNSRQSVSNNRKAIDRIFIGHKKLVTVKMVKKGRASYTEYAIDFPLLVSQVSLWSSEESSKNRTEKLTNNENRQRIVKESSKNRTETLTNSDPEKQQPPLEKDQQIQASEVQSSKIIDECRNTPIRKEYIKKEEATSPTDDKQKRILENGMTWGELLAIGNGIKIGAFDTISFGNNGKWLRYIEKQPRKRIIKVAAMDRVKSAPLQFVIERMYDILADMENDPEPKSRKESDFQVAISQYKTYCKWAKNGTADPKMAIAALKSCIALCGTYGTELLDELQISGKQLRQKLDDIVEESGNHHE